MTTALLVTTLAAKGARESVTSSVGVDRVMLLAVSSFCGLKKVYYYGMDDHLSSL